MPIQFVSVAQNGSHQCYIGVHIDHIDGFDEIQDKDNKTNSKQPHYELCREKAYCTIS